MFRAMVLKRGLVEVGKLENATKKQSVENGGRKFTEWRVVLIK